MDLQDWVPVKWNRETIYQFNFHSFTLFTLWNYLLRTNIASHRQLSWWSARVSNLRVEYWDIHCRLSQYSDDRPMFRIWPSVVRGDNAARPIWTKQKLMVKKLPSNILWHSSYEQSVYSSTNFVKRYARQYQYFMCTLFEWPTYTF